jgi:cobalt-zinc-cadmium efflux system protein
MHMHAHGHAHTARYVGWAIVLTLAFVAGEAVAGLFANSLALLADAGHNLADALALGLSLYALHMARRPADAQRTFGYHRVGILAALANAVSLVVIALAIFWEAAQRLRAPEETHSGTMIVTAVVALLVNGLISLWLHRDARHDLNVRSAYLHTLGDAASAVGVIAAGAVVAVTGSRLADPVASVLIGALILWSSWSILAEAVNVLLEGVPQGLDMPAVEQALAEVPGVLSAHHLHVWSVASGMVACSCHVVVAEQSVRSGQQVLRGVTDMLRQRFGITHTTVQVEVEGCEPGDMYCTMWSAHAGHHCAGHGHEGEQE